jgi:hypothetical protein
MRLGRVGAESERLAVVTGRLLLATDSVEKDGVVVVSLRVVWTQAQRVLVVLGRLVEASLGGEQTREPMVSVGMVGPEAQGLPGVLLGTGAPASGEERGVVRMRLGVVGP